jgi:hypothetical protein
VLNDRAPSPAAAIEWVTNWRLLMGIFYSCQTIQILCSYKAANTTSKWTMGTMSLVIPVTTRPGENEPGVTRQCIAVNPLVSWYVFALPSANHQWSRLCNTVNWDERA